MAMALSRSARPALLVALAGLVPVVGVVALAVLDGLLRTVALGAFVVLLALRGLVWAVEQAGERLDRKSVV